MVVIRIEQGRRPPPTRRRAHRIPSRLALRRGSSQLGRILTVVTQQPVAVGAGLAGQPGLIDLVQNRHGKAASRFGAPIPDAACRRSGFRASARDTMTRARIVVRVGGRQIVDPPCVQRTVRWRS